ncbi:hypothetical protein CBS101457_005541 [Exobasidium rhododendri]|nr:hypothetical protein CBS101457_005541 [Exobasidium rhododendri]
MNGQSSHAPLASLAAHWHACRGEIPPPLVGASVTLIDDGSDGNAPSSSASSSSSRSLPSCGKIYLFGGRLVTTRRMVNDMYVLDLSTLQWTKHSGKPDEDVLSDETQPRPRYFHSCDLWQGRLIIFGGMGYVQGSDSELCVLNEVVAFDLATQKWDHVFGKGEVGGDFTPEARYAHLSSVTANSLVVIGGQDMANHYVETINVFDLEERKWNATQRFGKQRGSYRSLAIGAAWTVDDRLSGQKETKSHAAATTPQLEKRDDPLLSEINLSPLPTSKKKWDDKGKERRLPIYIYTNYNFTDVKREMEIIEFQDRSDGEEGDSISVEDQSGCMRGISLPPGLRFPMGAMLGDHMLISGTYLANTSQTFAIWALYLPKMTWSRLDVGPLLTTGSWNRGVLWPTQTRLLVFGHRDRDLVSDYNHRQTNWDHVLIMELEAWGITQPPVESVSFASVTFGLEKLASSVLGSLMYTLPKEKVEVELSSKLMMGGRGDFEIICSDGMKLGCDRAILERRWPWFAAKMQEYRSDAWQKAQEIHRRPSSVTTPTDINTTTATPSLQQPFPHETDLGSITSKADPRITPRHLVIGEASPVVLALLIFLYTRCICTPLQRHPAIVAALLLLSKIYKMDDLEIWAKHAAQVSLAHDLSPPSDELSATPISPTVSSATTSLAPMEKHRLAVALYEAATMCGYEALQIRSLRTVMSIAKWVQRTSMRQFTTSDASTTHTRTPSTTSTTLLPEAGNNSYVANSGSMASPIRSSFATTTNNSPTSFKRSSATRGPPLEPGAAYHDQDKSTAMARRPSKAERMLGISGAELAASPLLQGKVEKRSESTQPDVGLSRTNSETKASSRPNTTFTPLESSLSSTTSPYRKSNGLTVNGGSHSNPTSHSNSLLNIQTPYQTGELVDGSSTIGRKRFSIFSKTPETARLYGSGIGTGMVDQSSNDVAAAAAAAATSSNDFRTSSDPVYANRTNSFGTNEEYSLTPGDDSPGSLPAPAFSERDMKRMERENGKGKLANLSRFRASPVKTNDASSVQGSNEVTLAPHRPAQGGIVTQPDHISNAPGKLSEEELKALYSIWS